jgi:hypothetical protein
MNQYQYPPHSETNPTSNLEVYITYKIQVYIKQIQSNS